jgi:alanine racemase
MAFIRLSRSAFYHNLDIIAQRAGNRDKIALVLKDNAYGHGLSEMAAMAKAYGIRRAVVRNGTEARQISGYFDYILVLSDIPTKEEETNGNTVYTVNALEQIARFPRGCRVELKVDTGMHRNGIAPQELSAAFAKVHENDLRLEGVFTHNRSADTLSSEWFWQERNFEAVKKEASALAEKAAMAPLRFHSSNSASLFRSERSEEDFVRVGIAAYGCLEMERSLEQPPLQPVLSLVADKIATRVLYPMQRVGYNGIYASEKEQTVSTYDVGYADGLMRSASDRYTTPEGARLLGRISMDNATFASDVKELLVFDNANRYADAAGTIGYEVLVRLNPLLERRIVE